MKKLGFVFDSTRCNGCRACLIACKEEKALPQGVWLRKVLETDDQMLWYSQSCGHCADPACLKVCPVKAYAKDADGLVIQDHAKCIGCQACVSACPYGIPSYSETEKKVYKCDGCSRRLAAGKQPACVANCPTKALMFGSVEDLKKELGVDAAAGWNWTIKVFGCESPDKTRPNSAVISL